MGEYVKNIIAERDGKTSDNEKAKRGRSAKTGLLQYAFSSYDKLEARWEKSAVYGTLYHASISKPVTRLRRVVSRSLERSRILSAVSRFTSLLPGVTLRAYGTFLFSIGLYSAVVYAVNTIASTLTSDIDTLITSVILMLAALPLLFSGKTLAEAVCESRVGGILAFELLGFRREEAELPRRVHKRCDIPMLLGMILGLTTFRFEVMDTVLLGFDPLEIVGVLFAAVIGYLVLTRPEAGVLLLFMSAAFLPTPMLRMYIMTLFIGYVYKLICGRRAFKLDLADAVMFVFACVFYFGGTVHYGVSDEVFYPSFVFVYFVIVNVIRDKKRREAARISVILGGVFIASAFLLSRFIDISALTEMYRIESRVLSSMIDSFAALSNELLDVMPYLIMVFPIMAAFVISRRDTKDSFSMLILSLVTVVSVVYTMSRGLWLGIAVGIAVLLIARDIKFMWIPVSAVSVFVMLLFVIRGPVRDFVFGILDMSGADTVNRITVRQNSARILLDNILGGIGVHDGVFESVYKNYSDFSMTVSNTQSMPLGVAVSLGATGFLIFVTAVIFLLIKAASGASDRKNTDRSMAKTATFAGVFSVIVSSMTSDIFHDEKMLLLFFMFAAFTSAYSAVDAEKLPDSRPMSVLDSKTASADIYFD